MFKDRFAGKVRDGTKQQTIRLSARCKAGDVLSLRRWTGKPYRSKQELIRTSICAAVRQVVMAIEPGFGFMLWVEGTPLLLDEIEAIAVADGFASAEDMIEWFMDEHGLPFSGWLIQWNAATGKAAP